MIRRRVGDEGEGRLSAEGSVSESEKRPGTVNMRGRRGDCGGGGGEIRERRSAWERDGIVVNAALAGMRRDNGEIMVRCASYAIIRKS